MYECDGTPTDCVRAGLLGGLAAEADLVVSGINHGANVADDVVYSGTIGAGLEAAGARHVRAVPVPADPDREPVGATTPTPGDYDFGLAARHGAAPRRDDPARPGQPRPIVLSVNYPAGPAPPAAGDGHARRRCSPAPGSASTRGPR